MKEPSHTSGSHRSCIGLIFTSQPDFLVDSGIHPSLHKNCHRQITCSKFHLKHFYPPPYERSIWHYIQANIDLIKKVTDNFDWKKYFWRLWIKYASQYLDWYFFDIMSNFIPNKIILIDTRDSPWIKKKIKVLIHDENLVYKNHFKKNNSDTQRAFSQIQTQHQLSIENLKLKYYQKLSNKLSNK